MLKKNLSLYFTLILALYPFVFTYMYFIVLSSQPTFIQQAIYSIGKLIQFSIPILSFVVLKNIKIFKFKISNSLPAILSGIFILIIILIFYYYASSFLLNPKIIKIPLESKLAHFGINNILQFIFIALFYSFIHSFLEEYYWRWAVYENFKQIIRSLIFANLLSALCFSLHHIILIYFYLNSNLLTITVCSLAVWIAGILWNTFYDKYQTLYVPWLSHVFADLAIFIIAGIILYGNIS